MKNNTVYEKSFEFAIKIVELYKQMSFVEHEYNLSSQIVRSGTSIGANIAEAQKAQTTPDFHAKMCIALKEANETSYWLNLFSKTGLINENHYNILQNDVNELIYILSAIVKSSDKK